MKKKDLIEFLRSTIEEDAIISRIFNLFHLNFRYSLNELNTLVEYGVENGYFRIEDVLIIGKQYNKVNWALDNVNQEIIMNDKEKYIDCLFSDNDSVPFEFMKFLDN